MLPQTQVFTFSSAFPNPGNPAHLSSLRSHLAARGDIMKLNPTASLHFNIQCQKGATEAIQCLQSSQSPVTPKHLPGATLESPEHDTPGRAVGQMKLNVSVQREGSWILLGRECWRMSRKSLVMLSYLERRWCPLLSRSPLDFLFAP